VEAWTGLFADWLRVHKLL